MGVSERVVYCQVWGRGGVIERGVDCQVGGVGVKEG